MADWPPLKAASIFVVFPIYDGSGCLVKGGGGLAACVCDATGSGSMTAATCTVTELSASAGVYRLRLTASEMTTDVLAWKVSSTTASARDAVGVLYTVTRQLQHLAFPATAGNGIAVDSASAVTVGSIAASAVSASALASAAASRIADVMLTGTTMAELGQAAPASAPTVRESLMLPYMALRNSASTSTSQYKITNNAGTVIIKSALSDSGSVFERGQAAAGP